MKTWIDIPQDSDFSIHNLPFGIFSTPNRPESVGVALGDFVVDLKTLAELGTFEDFGLDPSVFSQKYLNALMALGKAARLKLRARLQEVFTDLSHPLQQKKDSFLLPLSGVSLHLPVKIGDYTDFYSSQAHATNVGSMFRDPANALLPNWKHLPVAYHGRASTIFVSGTDFRRPSGQTRPSEHEPPVFGPTRQLDFELEMATVIGCDSTFGEPISTQEAEAYIFGFLLFNDWSARDIQRWEYVPLGPFLAKNFFSSVSPWVVTPEALAPFRVEAPAQDLEVLPYLSEKNRENFDVHLEVSLLTEVGEETTLSRSNFSYLYWTVAQQIAHHTSNGCHLQTGDLLASGTISGDTPGSYGSMLELAWGGKQPLTLQDGGSRTFIQDGDTVIFRGFAHKDGIRVGFGEVRNKVLPARPLPPEKIN